MYSRAPLTVSSNPLLTPFTLAAILPLQDIKAQDPAHTHST
jgi:hypothetical protein